MSTIPSLRHDRIIASVFKLASSAVRAYSTPPMSPLRHSVCTEKGVDYADGKKGGWSKQQGKEGWQGREEFFAVLMTPKRARKLWPWRILTSAFVTQVLHYYYYYYFYTSGTPTARTQERKMSNPVPAGLLYPFADAFSKEEVFSWAHIYESAKWFSCNCIF